MNRVSLGFVGGLRTKNLFTKVNLSDKPLVSIITVVRNGEDTLEKTIQSVIGQTYDNIEYILADGVSTDGTLEIIKKYEDKITYWVSEPDAGISDAMNKGIKLSNGELVGILHSGDYYKKDAVEEIVKAYLADKTIGVLHGDLFYYKDKKESIVVSPCMNPQRIWVTMIYNHPTCFVARRNYINFGNFDTSLKIAMDYELVLRLYLRGVKFHYVNKILAGMNIEGASSKQAIKGLREALHISIKYGYPYHKAIFFFVIKLIAEFILIIFLGNNRLLFQNFRKYWRQAITGSR